MNDRQFRALARPYIVTDGSRFRLKSFDPKGPGPHETQHNAKRFLKKSIKSLSALQERLYAQDRWGVLLIFQAMDAAGKDSAIKHVMSGIDPKGCQVYSFKAPSDEELDHDFMYGTTREFLERFGLNDINDLPKVDELADALGFELPATLNEPTETTSPLPFDDSSAAEEPEPASASAAPVEDPETVH